MILFLAAKTVTMLLYHTTNKAKTLNSYAQNQINKNCEASQTVKYNPDFKLELKYWIISLGSVIMYDQALVNKYFHSVHV